MKKRSQYIGILSVAGVSCIASPAFAQSSVTLYGIVDTALVYANNQGSLGSTSGGHPVTKLASGIWAGDRFGLKGTEDLGGGTKAIFQLESGFNLDNGTAIYERGVRAPGVRRYYECPLRHVHGRPPVLV